MWSNKNYKTLPGRNVHFNHTCFWPEHCDIDICSCSQIGFDCYRCLELIFLKLYIWYSKLELWEYNTINLRQKWTIQVTLIYSNFRFLLRAGMFQCSGQILLWYLHVQVNNNCKKWTIDFQRVQKGLYRVSRSELEFLGQPAINLKMTFLAQIGNFH